jgi:hypothetical protein
LLLALVRGFSALLPQVVEMVMLLMVQESWAVREEAVREVRVRAFPLVRGLLVKVMLGRLWLLEKQQVAGLGEQGVDQVLVQV